MATKTTGTEPGNEGSKEMSDAAGKDGGTAGVGTPGEPQGAPVGAGGNGGGEPTGVQPTPLPERPDDPDEGKTFDAAYVKKLREEAAERRKAVEAAEEKAAKAEARARDLFITAHTSKILADPEDLLAFDPEADLYEDGELSEEKVVAAANALKERKPHLAARTFGGDSGAGPRGKEPENKRSFHDILKEAAK